MGDDDPGPGPDEEQLLRHLGDVLGEVDGPPAAVYEAARAALGMRALEHELAELLSTSSELEGAVRADEGMRLLSFRSGSVAIEIEISTTGDETQLRGHVVGAGGEVVVDTTAGERRVPIGDDGWFTAHIRAAAAIRLRLVGSDGNAISTSWLSA